MKPAYKIALIYLVCGLLWIFLSDRVLCTFLACDATEVTKFQTVKGFFFIGCTALLLYFLTSRFYKNLADKIRNLEQSNLALEESEKRYSDLFLLSPLPMWVFDVNTLKFLVVNDAAVKQYGYSRAEFLDMTIADIRREEEVPGLLDVVANSTKEGRFVFRGTFRHRKKDGDMVTVEIRSNEMFYKGVEARLVLVNDITERMNYIADIEAKNEKLRQIAHMQSHVVRAPLATLMGFVNLLEETDIEDEERETMLSNILSSANELDAVIRKISETTKG